MQDHQQQELYKNFWKDRAEEYADSHILDGDSRKGLDILVLGCGTGSDCWHLTVDHHICGLDISESGVEIARAHGIDARLSSVTEPFPYPNSSFDIVVAKDILEHILDPLAVVKEVKRVLRRNGHLVTLIPNQFYWYFRLRYLLGKNLIWKTFMHDQTETFEEWNYIHVRFFTWKGVQKFLKVSGFQISKYYFDFGTFEHYFNPDRYNALYQRKWAMGEKKSKRGLLVRYVLYPLWRLLNIIFPKHARGRVVAWAPGLLTAAFYLRCTPDTESNQSNSDAA